VVGVIEGHPEFVWATFEQLDNAPNLLGVKSSEAVNNDKDKHFTFYAQGELASKCNQPNGKVFFNNRPRKNLLCC
jgi:hypothetical protein